MSRMIDRLLQRGFAKHASREGQSFRLPLPPTGEQAFLEEVEAAQVIAVDEVALFAAQELERGRGRGSWVEHFPCLAPSFTNFWLETRGTRLLKCYATGTAAALRGSADEAPGHPPAAPGTDPADAPQSARSVV